MNSSERRKSERFTGQIPIELRQGKAVTRDCSTDGVYFVTDQSFSVGEKIEFDMLLDHSGLNTAMRLHCLGKVLRVEPYFSRKTGVAVSYTINGFEKSMTDGRLNHPAES
jgi:hypothetical protein